MNSLFDNHIELAFDKMVEHHNKGKKNSTSIRDVLQYLVDKTEVIWFWSWEFAGNVTSTGKFLSHRACARASDLALHFPNLVEGRRIGRFCVYRLRRENMEEIRSFLELK